MAPTGTLGIAACFCAPLLAAGTAAVAQETHRGLVLVQRTVETNYEARPEDFEQLLRSSLTRAYVVKPGDSLQKIIAGQFAMGPGTTPKLYEGMAARLQTQNDLVDRESLKAGLAIDLPDLPPVQWKRRSADNPNYGVPRVQGGPSYEAVLKGRVSDVRDDARKILDAGRKAEGLVNQWRWLTVEQAKVEAEADGLSKRLTIWSQPIEIKFAQAAPATVTPTLAADLRHVGSLTKRRTPRQDVVLFVLDDSWPSETAFEDSRRFIVDALRAVAKANYFEAPKLPLPIVDGTARTTFPLRTPGRHSHAALIDAALADFRTLSPRVKVIHLPLFNEQKWARELWKELTYTTLVASGMFKKLGEAAPGADITSRARSDAENLVDQIPTRAVDSLGPAEQTPVTVLHKFAQLYSRTTGVPYFISMSWTVEKQEMPFGPDPDVLGVSLAASGNDAKDVVADAIYLAYRAKAAPGDVLAVMNTDGAGRLLCDSNRLPLAGPNPFYGLAYDGSFGAATPGCGSSFSTPRVAWLLALRQAYEPPIAKARWSDWYASFRTSIVGLQDATDPSSRRYWLPVTKLFEGL